MTTLLLSVTRGPSALLHQTRMVSSGAFGVGRAQPSDWVLEDPRRVLSKRHCVFQQDEGGWSVADVSRNGSFVARGSETVRLGPQPHRLEPGEKVRLGDYELAVDLQEDEGSFLTIPLSPSRGTARDGSIMPPDVPQRSYPRPVRGRIRQDDEAEPTRFMLQRPGGGGGGGAARAQPGLPEFLSGAGLSPEDVPDGDGVALRAAGAALRAAVSGLRDLRFATLGESDPEAAGQNTDALRALPLSGAGNDREAAVRLLNGEAPSPTAVEASFREIQLHHDWLVRAARRSLREVMLSLDPDQPRQQLLPHWLDVLPGWRRWRGAVLARRRFRRMTANMDKTVDQALARAYWDVRRETELRWNPP